MESNPKANVSPEMQQEIDKKCQYANELIDASNADARKKQLMREAVEIWKEETLNGKLNYFGFNRLISAIELEIHEDSLDNANDVENNDAENKELLAAIEKYLKY